MRNEELINEVNARVNVCKAEARISPSKAVCFITINRFLNRGADKAIFYKSKIERFELHFVKTNDFLLNFSIC